MFSICCPPPKIDGGKKNLDEEDDTVSPSWFSDLEIKEDSSDTDNDNLRKEESFVKVIIDKPTPDSLLGIAYQKSQPKSWRYVLSRITSGGLAERTGKLQPGQTILGINDTPCTEWRNVTDVTNRLKSIPDQVELIVTKSVMATIHKKTKATKAGIVFCQAARTASTGDAIWIYQLEPKGLFDQTGILKVGMRVIAINGKMCPPVLAQVQDMVQQAVGYVSIVAVSDGGVPFVPMPESPSPPSISSLSDNEEQKL